MGLRELALYGRDKQFGRWFHQQCTYIQSSSDIAARQFRSEELAASISKRSARQLDHLIGLYVSGICIAYLALAIAADQSEEYLLKRQSRITGIIITVFGPQTLEVYHQIINYIVDNKVNPESAATHLMVDGLEISSNTKMMLSRSHLTSLKGACKNF